MGMAGCKKVLKKKTGLERKTQSVLVLWLHRVFLHPPTLCCLELFYKGYRFLEAH